MVLKIPWVAPGARVVAEITAPSTRVAYERIGVVLIRTGMGCTCMHTHTFVKHDQFTVLKCVDFIVCILCFDQVQ